MADEIGWLVEFPPQSERGIEGCAGVERASWWLGDEGSSGGPRATHDASEALRFARKCDAEKAIQAHGGLRRREAIATEHAWVGGERYPGSQLRAKAAALDAIEEWLREDSDRDVALFYRDAIPEWEARMIQVDTETTWRATAPALAAAISAALEKARGAE